LIAVSTPVPGSVKEEWVMEMTDDSIVFVQANPVPGVWPWEVKETSTWIVVRRITT
jgi:malate dehydrogenase (oxaloacetate-decarboxylating)